MAFTYALQSVSATPIKGQVVQGINFQRLSVRVDPASTSVIQGGTGVKITGSSNFITYVDKAAATDRTFGFVIESQQNSVFTAGQMIDIALGSCAMVMEAGTGGVTANSPVEIVATGDKVINAAGTNLVVGIAETTAVAGAAVIVYIKPSSSATVY